MEKDHPVMQISEDLLKVKSELEYRANTAALQVPNQEWGSSRPPPKEFKISAATTPPNSNTY